MALFIYGPKGKWIIGDNCEIKPDKSQKFPKFQRAPGCTSVLCCLLELQTQNYFLTNFLHNFYPLELFIEASFILQNLFLFDKTCK